MIISVPIKNSIVCFDARGKLDSEKTPLLWGIRKDLYCLFVLMLSNYKEFQDYQLLSPNMVRQM
jgi:hypothetical protein